MAKFHVVLNAVKYQLDTCREEADVIAFVGTNALSALVLEREIEHDGKRYTVKRIADCAFKDCSLVQKISIPDSIWHIGFCAFAYSTIESFQRTILSGNPKPISIETAVFQDCSKLRYIDFGGSVEFLGMNSLLNCSISELYFVSDNLQYCIQEPTT